MAKQWRDALQTREELDIGCILAMTSANWSPGVASMRLRVLEMAKDIGETMIREDNQHWEPCAKEFNKAHVVKDSSALSEECEVTVLKVEAGPDLQKNSTTVRKQWSCGVKWLTRTLRM